MITTGIIGWGWEFYPKYTQTLRTGRPYFEILQHKVTMR